MKLKVADFGISKLLNGMKLSDFVEPDYMAPEKQLSMKSDIW